MMSYLKNNKKSTPLSIFNPEKSLFHIYRQQVSNPWRTYLPWTILKNHCFNVSRHLLVYWRCQCLPRMMLNLLKISLLNSMLIRSRQTSCLVCRNTSGSMRWAILVSLRKWKRHQSLNVMNQVQSQANKWEISITQQ